MPPIPPEGATLQPLVKLTPIKVEDLLMTNHLGAW